MNKAFSLSRYDKPVRALLFIVSALPFFWCIQAYYYDGLGLNPFETLMAVSGHSALIFLLISLAITPLRRWLIWAFRLFKSLRFDLSRR